MISDHNRPPPDSSPRRELPRPYLQSTVRELERRTGRCGRALVACVAARRVHLPWVDLEPLAAGCAAHLAGDSGAVDTATRRFVACVLGVSEERNQQRGRTSSAPPSVARSPGPR